MKNILKAITAFLLVGFMSCYSQTGALKTGDKKYDNLAYLEAVKTYERIAAKGYQSVDLFSKLGNSYFFNAKLKEANKWYEALFGLNQKVDPEYYYRYALTLKAIGDYKKADAYLENYQKLSSTEVRAQLYTNQKNYKEIIDNNSGRYEIKTTSINTNKSDYGTAFYGDKVVFASARDSVGIAGASTKWTKQAFTNLYSANIDENSDLIKAKRFSGTINSKFHEDSPVFTKDLKTVYFTRNNYNKGKVGKDGQDVILLKLYKAELIDQKWQNVTELPFNRDNYSVAHPALSTDEKTLYFASNMPGSQGQSDIFKVAILENNQYGTPENLGSLINTEGRETFPFISSANELYFASDGHQGLGGLDIFVTPLDASGNPTTIVNIGAPVNGPMDDFAFIIDYGSKKGYFSSNREAGKGQDDIYSFTEKKPLQINLKHILEGVITDLETKALLPNTKVSLLDVNFKLVEQVVADASGAYLFTVKPGQKYYVRAEREEYDTNEASITIPNKAGKSNLPIAIAKKVKEIKEGTDIAKTFDIKIIYFDLDKSFIRKDAALELEKILDVLQQYPSMQIDIRSHTDSRQTDKYNQQLSDRRAKATLQWLVKNGIKADRLTAKGYGETQLVNHCADGVNCSEQEHQANRRSEFIVVKM